MKILIKTENDDNAGFFIEMTDEEFNNNFKCLIENGDYSKAVISAMLKGRERKEVTHSELPYIDAGLILSHQNVRFDLI